jgi:hypothetical protein
MEIPDIIVAVASLISAIAAVVWAVSAQTDLGQIDSESGTEAFIGTSLDDASRWLVWQGFVA